MSQLAGDTITVLGFPDPSVDVAGSVDKLGIPIVTPTQTVVPNVSIDALKSKEIETSTDLITSVRTIYQDRPIHPALMGLRNNDRVLYLGKEWRVQGDPYIGTYFSGLPSHIRFEIRRG